MPEWTVPGYTELRQLGAGGFGNVVLAKHDASGTLVAIKYLKDELLADREFAEMFRGEASVLASLDDPNVVRLYEYVESPSGAAIVMELIGGASLRQILSYQGKTGAEAALVVLHGSLMGLAAAHRRGVVHRDYKPENVLVRGDGASKLTDFGIAARTGDHPVPAGTLPYAAPEQIAGASASPASDIYAATATFYECLTGRPPRPAAPAQSPGEHQSGPAPLEAVPKALRPLVSAGLAAEPDRRPMDASAFVTDLQRAASRACGRHWHKRGRSQLGDAALLLAAMWPGAVPPAFQDTTVRRIRLRRQLRLQHITAVKAALAAGTVIVGAAAGTALAATSSSPSFKAAAATRPAAVQRVSVQPSPIAPAALPPTPVTLAPAATGSSSGGSPASAAPSVPSSTAPAGVPAPPSTSKAATTPATNSASAPAQPAASVCEPDGTGCTKGGTYSDPDALISSDYGGFKLIWSSTSVQPYTSGVPLYWTVGVTYQNTGSAALSLRCQGPVTDLSSVQEHMSGGDGDDGSVSASGTTCSQDPGWSAEVPPGGTAEVYATFHNVPWPGVAVAIQWGDVGTSAPVFPFS